MANATESQLKALERRLKALQDQMAIQQRDNDYNMGVLGLKRSWQAVEEENLSISEPLHLELYIPPTTKSIKSVILRLKLKPYRAYSSVIGLPAPVTLTTGDASWGLDDDSDAPIGNDGSHDHGGAVTSDGSHNHPIKTHVHPASLPEHWHNQWYAIINTGTPKDVSIAINGVDVTDDLGGPFNEDQDSLDITQYIQAIGWNDIQFSCGADATLDPPRGRIRASLFAEIYLP